MSKAVLKASVQSEKTLVEQVATTVSPKTGAVRAPLSRAQRFSAPEFDAEIPPEQQVVRPSNQTSQNLALATRETPLSQPTSWSEEVKTVGFPLSEKGFTVVENTVSPPSLAASLAAPVPSPLPSSAAMTPSDRVQRMRVIQDGQKAQAPQILEPVDGPFKGDKDLFVPSWDDDKRPAGSEYS
jgi:hypothetical protein